jgi:ubiquinone/menaquinone biosynthesis C-methylase UbiE
MNEARKKWYAEWFNETYLKVYAHRNSALARSEVQFVARILGLKKDQPILDLCCGAGRHLRGFQEFGFEKVYGLDLSEPLLAVAREQLKQSEVLVRADMRALPFQTRSFSAVLSLFTSFGYFRENDDNQEVLNQIHAILQPGGRVLLDLVSYGIADRLVPVTERTVEGIHVVEKRRYDSHSRRIEKEITITDSEGTETFFESVRIYTFKRISILFATAGLAIEGVYGDFNGGPFHPSGERMIVVGKKLSVPAHLAKP